MRVFQNLIDSKCTSHMIVIYSPRLHPFLPLESLQSLILQLQIGSNLMVVYEVKLVTKHNFNFSLDIRSSIKINEVHSHNILDLSAETMVDCLYIFPEPLLNIRGGYHCLLLYKSSCLVHHQYHYNCIIVYLI